MLHLGANEAGELRQLLAAERIAADRGEAAEVALNITVNERERAESAAADSAMNLGAIEAVWAGLVGGWGNRDDRRVEDDAANPPQAHSRGTSGRFRTRDPQPHGNHFALINAFVRKKALIARFRLNRP